MTPSGIGRRGLMGIAGALAFGGGVFLALVKTPKGMAWWASIESVLQSIVHQSARWGAVAVLGYVLVILCVAVVFSRSDWLRKGSSADTNIFDETPPR